MWKLSKQTLSWMKRCLKSQRCFNCYLWSEMIKYRFIIAKKMKWKWKTSLQNRPHKDDSLLSRTVQIFMWEQSSCTVKIVLSKPLECSKITKAIFLLTKHLRWPQLIAGIVLRYERRYDQPNHENARRSIKKDSFAVDKTRFHDVHFWLIQFCNPRWLFVE